MANEYRIEQLEKQVEANAKNIRVFAEEVTELSMKLDELIEKEWERVEVVRQAKADENETNPKRVIFEYE